MHDGKKPQDAERFRQKLAVATMEPQVGKAASGASNVKRTLNAWMSTHDRDRRVAKVVSVNVGLPREISWRGRTVFTGISKEAVQS